MAEELSTGPPKRSELGTHSWVSRRRHYGITGTSKSKADYQLNPNPPNIGEIRFGLEIGRKTNERRIWLECPLCKKPRWIPVNYEGLYDNKNCNNCHMKLSGRQRNLGKTLPIGSRCVPEKDGYVCIKTEQGWELEHRFVMSQILGRPLSTYERVHHKNGIRTDNRPDNLELFNDNSSHVRQHNKGYQDGYKQGYSDAVSQISEMAKNQKLVSWQVKNLTDLVNQIVTKFKEVPV
jgi:hypothetical protein